MTRELLDGYILLIKGIRCSAINLTCSECIINKVKSTKTPSKTLCDGYYKDVAQPRKDYLLTRKDYLLNYLSTHASEEELTYLFSQLL